MSDERNPALERLFRAADQELDGERFVARVMERTSTTRARVLMGLALLLAAAPVAWLAAELLNDSLLWLMQLMAKPIAGSGEGLSSPAVLPMNNVGAGVVLGFLVVRAVARRIFSAGR